MKNRKSRRGFTIVELVIVIAVIGVLAAVLIPVFVSLTSRANKEADNHLVVNLNKALAATEVDIDARDEETGVELSGKNETMYDAVLDLEYQGYKFENLYTRTGEKLLWNADTNRFTLESYVRTGKYDGSKTTIDLNYWVVETGSEISQSKYSVLAGNKLSGDISITTGFDAGRYANVTSVTYDRSTATQKQDVIIRTNGGKLIINAPLDTVRHYGFAEVVDLQQVAYNSYHENEESAFIKIKSGRVVLNEDANVTAIHIVASSDDSSNETYFDDIAIALVGTSQIPTITRDPISVDEKTEEGTYTALVIEVQNLEDEEGEDENPEYIWVTVVVDGEGESTTTTTVSSSSTDSTAEVEEETPAATAIAETTTDSIDEDTAESKAVLFGGGSGTLADPYLISTFEGLLNVDAVSEGSETLYYQMTEDLVAEETTNWANGYLYKDPANYVIDMNGHKLTVGDAYVFGYAVNLEMHSGTIDFAGAGSLIGYACYQDMPSYNINFHDLVLTGTIENSSAHYGPLVAYAFGINSGSAQFNASNVTSNVRIVNNNSTGYVGGLFGYVQGSAVSSTVTNCTFNGSIVAAHAGGFLNPCSYPNAGMTSSGNILNGQLLASKTAIAFGCNTNLKGGKAALDALQETVTIGTSAAMTVVAASTNLINLDSNNQVILNKADNVDHYRVAITFNVDKADGTSGGYPRYITTDINAFEEDSVETGIYKFAIVQEASDMSEGKTIVTDSSDCKIWLDGGKYHVYCPDFSVSNNKATIWAYGYDANNSIVTYQSMAYSY